MQSKAQGSRRRPGTQNNSRPKTDPVEAKDRNDRGLGHVPRTQHASVLKKRFSYIYREVSGAFSKMKKKKCPDLGPFFTNQKIVLSSIANRAFSRTCRLGSQGQGLYLQGQGLQNVFSRTSSRTPPLNNSNAIQNKINIFFT